MCFKVQLCFSTGRSQFFRGGGMHSGGIVNVLGGNGLVVVTAETFRNLFNYNNNSMCPINFVNSRKVSIYSTWYWAFQTNIIFQYWNTFSVTSCSNWCPETMVKPSICMRDYHYILLYIYIFTSFIMESINKYTQTRIYCS